MNRYHIYLNGYGSFSKLADSLEVFDGSFYLKKFNATEGTSEILAIYPVHNTAILSIDKDYIDKSQEQD